MATSCRCTSKLEVGRPDSNPDSDTYERSSNDYADRDTGFGTSTKALLLVALFSWLVALFSWRLSRMGFCALSVSHSARANRIDVVVITRPQHQLRRQGTLCMDNQGSARRAFVIGLCGYSLRQSNQQRERTQDSNQVTHQNLLGCSPPECHQVEPCRCMRCANAELLVSRGFTEPSLKALRSAWGSATSARPA